MISSQYISRITLQRDKVGDFGRYPFALPAVRELDQLDMHPKVTYFVGENGSGKSTLLEAIALGMGFKRDGMVQGQLVVDMGSRLRRHLLWHVARGA